MNSAQVIFFRRLGVILCDLDFERWCDSLRSVDFEPGQWCHLAPCHTGWSSRVTSGKWPLNSDAKTAKWLIYWTSWQECSQCYCKRQTSACQHGLFCSLLEALCYRISNAFGKILSFFSPHGHIIRLRKSSGWRLGTMSMYQTSLVVFACLLNASLTIYSWSELNHRAMSMAWTSWCYFKVYLQQLTIPFLTS